MDKLENRDDLVKRVVAQREKDERRVTTSKEKEQIAEYIKKDVMPRIYEGK